MGTRTFSSPTVQARSSLVRCLGLVDEVESAWSRRDWPAIQNLADAIRVEMRRVRYATDVMAGDPAPTEAPDVTPDWQRPEARFRPVGPDDQAHPMTESELRAAYGDR